MCTTAAPVGAGCWWPRCLLESAFQLLQPADGEIHKLPNYWILIWPLMLGPGPVRGRLVSALCWVLTKEIWWHYSHIFAAIFLTFSSFQTPFPQGNAPGHPTLSFPFQVSSSICHQWLSGAFSNLSFSPCLQGRLTLVPAAYCLQH